VQSTPISPMNEMVAKESLFLLADDGCRLRPIQEGMRRVPVLQRCTDRTSQHVARHNKTMAFQRMGVGLHRGDTSIVVKGHRFVLVTTNYFTKWIEVVPLKNMTHKKFIGFMQEHNIYRFRMPQTLTTDQGSSFMLHQFKEFTDSLKIKLRIHHPITRKQTSRLSPVISLD
jgi:IS30 family transposase